MSIWFRLGGESPLLPGERLLHTQRSLRLVSARSWPSYRLGFQAPPLGAMTLQVTDRRLRVVTKFFLGALTQEFDAWYPGALPEGESEIVTRVATGRGILGGHLGVETRDPERPWYWFASKAARFRFYFRDPEGVAETIGECMARAAARSGGPSAANGPRPG